MALKILLIDDDSDFRNAIRAVLEKEGYTVGESDSAREGHKKLQTFNPDLILLDAMMEDLSAGFRFVKSLRKMEPSLGRHIPVIMITSVQQVTDLQFSERLGTDLLPVDDFLEKPVEPRALLEKVGSMLKAA
ncbi:MAG TPA: response regulator [bacterium]|nr:response regulator [bacterium]